MLHPLIWLMGLASNLFQWFQVSTIAFAIIVIFGFLLTAHIFLFEMENGISYS